MLTDKFLQHHEHVEPDKQNVQDKQNKLDKQNKQIFASGCCVVIIINFAAFLFLYYWRTM